MGHLWSLGWRAYCWCFENGSPSLKSLKYIYYCSAICGCVPICSEGPWVYYEKGTKMLLMFNPLPWDSAQLALICCVLVPLFQWRRHRTNSLRNCLEETALNRSLSPQNVFTPILIFTNKKLYNVLPNMLAYVIVWLSFFWVGLLCVYLKPAHELQMIMMVVIYTIFIVFELSTVTVHTWILAVFYPIFRVLLLPWFLQGALCWKDIFMLFSIRFIMFMFYNIFHGFLGSTCKL